MVGNVQNILSSLVAHLQINFKKIPLDRTTKIALGCLLAAVPLMYGIYKFLGRIKKVQPLPVEHKVTAAAERAVIQAPLAEDPEKGFQRAAAAGELSACHALLWIYRNDPIQALKTFEKAADLGDTEAQIVVGTHHWKNSNGCAVRQEEAMSYFLKAHQADHPEASFRIGTLWAEGWSSWKADPVKARQYFELAARKGHGDAECELEKLDAQKQVEVEAQAEKEVKVQEQEQAKRPALKALNRDALRRKREGIKTAPKPRAEGKENTIPV